jgi:hypothetical protein
MNDLNFPKTPNKQLSAEEIYSADDEQLLRLGCVDCFALTETTLDKITEDNHIVCPECLSTRDVDVDYLMQQRELIRQAVRKYREGLETPAK